MKKLIWIPFVIISILLFCIIYFNSYAYRYECARKLRDARIEALNKVPRRFIKEGVYSFDYTRYTSTNVKDKFGKWVSLTNNYPIQKGEVSFTSKKIVIHLGKKIEELTISDPTITGFSNSEEQYIEYQFRILSWKAYDDISWFNQYDTTHNYKLRKIMGKEFFDPIMTLQIKTTLTNNHEESTAELNLVESVSGYNISDYDINGKRITPRKKVPFKYSELNLPREIDTDDNKFIFSMVRGNIYMDNLEYAYSTNKEPEYVKEADYVEKEYDINNYL